MSFREPSQPPAAERHHGPHSFHRSERPCALQKAINRAQCAGESEGKDEPRAAFFQRVENQHRRNGEQSKSGKKAHCGSIDRIAIVMQSPCKEWPRSSNRIADLPLPGIFAPNNQGTPNYFCILSAGGRSISRSTPVPPRESPNTKRRSFPAGW